MGSASATRSRSSVLATSGATSAVRRCPRCRSARGRSFARPVGAPVRGVVAVRGLGVLAHLAGLAAYVHRVGQLPLTGLGPSLSFAGLVLAATLLLVEALARDVSLTLVAAPLAAVPT